MSESETPLVSIVIPTYNHAQFLGRALQSLFNQTYAHWEAIIVDNHSTDNTDEVIRKFADPRITYLKIHNNGIIAVSRNRGIRAAKGSWVAFLDSDDWWAPDKLKHCLDHGNENVDVIYHDLEIVGRKKTLFGAKNTESRQLKKPVIVDLLANGSALGNSSVVVRKKVLDCIGAIDESPDMVGCEDYNTWLQIAQITDGFLYIPQVLGYYFVHQNNNSQRDMSAPLECARAKFDHLLSDRQRNRYQGRVQYVFGRSAYCSQNFIKAKSSLLCSLQYGSVMNKLKSFYMLMSIGIFKKG